MSEAKGEPQYEAWVCQIPGRVAVGLEDLATARVRTISVKGKGQVLRLTDQQRELAEERIVYPEHNPFRNGMLVRRGDGERTAQELADDELAAAFELDDADFDSFVGGMSEVNVRRLLSLAVERDASYNQVGLLKEKIEERWPAPVPGPTQQQISEIGVMS
ncbi:hypothetical protein GCM10028801_30770 [Nocardioides maradonensis]